MTTLYAIPNCNTVKKARTWLEEHHIDYDFHNYKKQHIDKTTLEQWVKEFGWEVIINRKGMTWRKLDNATRESMDTSSAIQTMLDNPSIIKRPIINKDGKIIVGFNEQEYEVFFQ